MRIFVTGSRGNIGAELVAELRRRGHDVWGCDLDHSPDPQHVRADIAEYRQIHRAFEIATPDLCYHLAAEFGRVNGANSAEQLWRTNALGVHNVADVCASAGVRLVFASSSEAYGDSPDAVKRENELERADRYFHNEYALSKYVGEHIIEIAMRTKGLRARVLRLFNVYGREHYTPYRSVVCKFIHAALNGDTPTVYDGMRDFLYIDDGIPTIANVCERFDWLPERAYNIGGDDYRGVQELWEIVARECGAGEVRTQSREAFNVYAKRPDLTLARRDLGHDPVVRLGDGVKRTVEWMRAQQC